MLWSARHRPDANAEYKTLVLNPSRGRPLRESGSDAVGCDRLDITASVLPETTVHVELANTVQKRNTRTEIASGKNGTGFEIVVAWQRFIGKPSSCPGVEEVQPNIAAICDRRSPGDAILPTNGRKLIITQYELHKDLVPVCVDRRTGGNKKTDDAQYTTLRRPSELRPVLGPLCFPRADTVHFEQFRRRTYKYSVSQGLVVW